VVVGVGSGGPAVGVLAHRGEVILRPFSRVKSGRKCSVARGRGPNLTIAEAGP
jgi:hypothetical protein